MGDRLKQFIFDNIDLINQNTKESWENIYNNIPYDIAGEFTQAILDSRINDPASILGYIPEKYLYGSNIQRYIIPDNVMSIGDYAFAHCKSLINVVIPNGVTLIDSRAFWCCRSLTSVVIPDTVIEISDQAFSECTKLTDVVIPDSVKIIGSGAFLSCYRLDSIKYNGTKKQWGKISHRGSMVGYSSESWGKIICTDGEIEL